jgi:hypothetical protein
MEVERTNVFYVLSKLWIDDITAEEPAYGSQSRSQEEWRLRRYEREDILHEDPRHHRAFSIVRPFVNET